MTAIRSNYSNILNENTILHMPSCLVVEMMAKLYSQVAVISLSGTPHSMVPDLLILLQRLTYNLATTAEAYRENRISFFIGDWRQDKLRARKLFFNIMSRLGYLSEMVGEVEKRLLFRAIEEMSAVWAELDAIVEEKCVPRKCGAGCNTCRYFRCDNPDRWQQIMAKTILALDADAQYPSPDTYLILICYKRVKIALLKAIEVIESRSAPARRFLADRILCVSADDCNITCPTCSMMTESLRKGNSEVIHKSYAPTGGSRVVSLKRGGNGTALRGRYPMPPSLAGISR